MSQEPPEGSPPSRPGWLERLCLHRPELRAWALYDWANSALYTVIITAVFPIFFQNVAAEGLDGDTATVRFTLATALSLTLVAVLALPLGALADTRALRKRLLAGSMGFGALACVGMFFIGPGDWALALILFGLANAGAGLSVVFYDALLNHVARVDEVDRVSTSGYALGYVGGGLLLAFGLFLISSPATFGLPSGEGLTVAQASLPARIAFVTVGLWWAFFTLPLLRRVPEPPADPTADDVPIAARLRGTFRELRRFPDAARMLLAFLIYNDGVQTVIRVATIYGATIGLAREDMITAVLMVQFIGIPFAFLFGGLAQRTGAKRAIFLALAVYLVAVGLGYRLQDKTDFFLLGALVGMCQGGAQALSRSLFSSLIPRQRSAEFFAFFAVGEKFAGIGGPLLFGLFVTLGGGTRNAVAMISLFFLVGGWLLRGVDVERGRRRAAEEEAALEAAS